MEPSNPFAKVVSTDVIIILSSVTSPQDAFSDHEWRSLIGSSLVEITPDPGGPPPFTNLATLNWPGTIVTADPILGSGHGAWKRTGRRDSEIRFLTLVPPDNPFGFWPNIILTVTASLTVDESGDEANGTNVAEFLDSFGNVLARIEALCASRVSELTKPEATSGAPCAS